MILILTLAQFADWFAMKLGFFGVISLLAILAAVARIADILQNTPGLAGVILEANR